MLEAIKSRVVEFHRAEVSYLKATFKETRAVYSGTGPNVDLSLPGLTEQVEGNGAPSASATGAVVFALGEVHRAFLAARVEPAIPGLTPSILASMARYTLASGNSVWEIQDDGPAFLLLPAARHSVQGPRQPDLWRYQMDFYSPDDVDNPLTRNVPAEGVIHLRWDPPEAYPWVGISPLARAGITADQLGYIEKRMQEEASGNVGYLMPVPDGTPVSNQNKAANAMRDARGRTQIVETTAAGFGQGPGSAPRNDWQQVRFGPDIPASSLSLREGSSKLLMSVLGVPPSLFDGAGAALRESHRAFLTRTLHPMARLLEEELSEKLERNLAITFPAIVEGDIAARARAAGSLIQAGADFASVMSAVGLSEIQEGSEPGFAP